MTEFAMEMITTEDTGKTPFTLSVEEGHPYRQFVESPIFEPCMRIVQEETTLDDEVPPIVKEVFLETLARDIRRTGQALAALYKHPLLDDLLRNPGHSYGSLSQSEKALVDMWLGMTPTAADVVGRKDKVASIEADLLAPHVQEGASPIVVSVAGGIGHSELEALQKLQVSSVGLNGTVCHLIDMNSHLLGLAEQEARSMGLGGALVTSRASIAKPLHEIPLGNGDDTLEDLKGEVDLVVIMGITDYVEIGSWINKPLGEFLHCYSELLKPGGHLIVTNMITEDEHAQLFPEFQDLSLYGFLYDPRGVGWAKLYKSGRRLHERTTDEMIGTLQSVGLRDIQTHYSPYGMHGIFVARKGEC